SIVVHLSHLEPSGVSCAWPLTSSGGFVSQSHAHAFACTHTIDPEPSRLIDPLVRCNCLIWVTLSALELTLVTVARATPRQAREWHAIANAESPHQIGWH